MKLAFIPLAALALIGCTDATASKDPPAVVVLLRTSPDNPNCVIASPDPAAIRAGESIAFRNVTAMSHIILAEGVNTPWTAVAPGETSGSIEFTFASTRKYYVQACGSSGANLHTLVITVN